MADDDFTDLVDLASERIGGSVLLANDEFFAEKENLLRHHAAVWKDEEYTDRGKWMDGWETRRRREPGDDWCIVRLGLPGLVRGVIVDTSFFRGNYPESCSLEACAVEGYPDPASLLEDDTGWVEIVPRSPLEGHTKNRFAVRHPLRVTHLRLRIYPDGGVARLRVHGEPRPDWRHIGGAGREIDLAALENGAAVPLCSDMFFGSRHNLVMPGRPRNMGEGWETRRRRGPGNDWSIVRLAGRGRIARVEVDTTHFQGNAPGSCVLEGCDLPGGAAATEAGGDAHPWVVALSRTKLLPNTVHLFDELAGDGPFTHVRLSIFPDGGVARLRVHGRLEDDARRLLRLERLETLARARLETELAACCGSTAWVRTLADSRPWGSPDALFAAAERIWRELADDDWLEAFRHHPRIGGSSAPAGQSAQARSWSSGEQSAAATADDELRRALAEIQLAYEERFGFVFLVCATGKSASEILELARQRITHDRETELRIAAREQAAITRLRLEKSLTP